MNREELLKSLESALAAQDWEYVQQLQGVLISLGDTESVTQMESLLKKAKDLQSQPPIEANSSQVDNFNQANMNSPKSPIINLSDSLERIERLAIRMRDKSQIIESGSPTVYKLPLKIEMEDKKNLISKYHIGKSSLPEPSEKVLMVVGATGAGKTTLINGMVNYILGVEWKDDFRFKLIVEEGGYSQAHSQTKSITAYTLHPMKGSNLTYKLTIIDTPGFGDTEGLKRDKFIINQIREFFSMPNGIPHLDGIGFVVQNSQSRLTPTQKYIFDSILSIFGNDVASNIFIMVTFADAEYPPVMAAIKEDNISHSQFFQFNNSAVFAQKHAVKNKKFTEMFWDMGFTSFEEFFTDLQKAETKSLQLTKEVLKERKQLETLIEGLLPQIKKGLSQLNQLQQEEAMLDQHKANINANKNFTFPVKVTKTRQVNKPSGSYVTNCSQCGRTCHDNCAYSDDEDKYRCSAMDNGGIENAICTVCPGKCSWRLHRNRPYRIEDYEETETRTVDDLKKRYNIAVSGKNQVESIINELNKELQAVCEDVFRMIQLAQQSLRRLNAIALKPNPLTEVQYIDLLIESEKQEGKLGWEQRIAYYQEARECAQLLSNMKNATDIEKEENIKEWAKKLISKLKDAKSKSDSQPRRKNDPKTGAESTANPQSWFESWKRPFS
ncbi:GTPase [Microcoleus anatoxicus]|uniref:GTPase n=1 Tax=Microcoleus anatoxicus TaxID=2705319 RepID=UPI0030C8E2B9